MKSKLIREIRIAPAYDKRSDDPAKDYGIGSCRIWFIVKGKAGAITVNFGTNWYLPSTVKEYKEIGIHRNTLTPFGKESFKTKIDLEKDSTKPISAWSWDYHSKKKIEYSSYHKKCEFLDGKSCYCDGSYMRAEKYLKALIEKGSDAVFKMLEQDYRIEFEKVKK